MAYSQSRHRPGHAARPDFHQLETFLKVVECKSFVGAARQLGVTQPAVSQTIARLEEMFGGDLFERNNGSPVTLTPIGHAILPKAKLLLFTVDQQMRRAIATAQSLVGSFSVGLCAGIAIGPLNSGLADFRHSRPDVDVRIVEASPPELHRQLNERSLDIVFTAFIGDKSSAANQKERIWDDDIVVAMPDGHQLAGNGHVAWADLSAVPIIMRSNGSDLTTYRAVAARMRDHPFHCDLHDVSQNMLFELVRLGFGATICLASEVVPRDGSAVRAIADRDATVTIEAIWPRADRNPLRHRLLSCVRKYAATP